MSSGKQQGRKLAPGDDHIRVRRTKRGEEFQKLQPCRIVIPATLDPDGLQKLGHRLGIRADGEGVVGARSNLLDQRAALQGCGFCTLVWVSQTADARVWTLGFTQGREL